LNALISALNGVFIFASEDQMEAGFHLFRTKQKGVNTPPLAAVSRGESRLSIPRGLPRGGFILFVEPWEKNPGSKN